MKDGRVAQWQERLTHIQEVVGSIPTAPTTLEVRGRKSEAGEKIAFCIVLATFWPYFFDL